MLSLILMGFFALLGLAISGYIFYKKQKHENLVCLVGDDCNKVVRSKYGNLLFGIPNEVMGAGYYTAVLMGVILLFFGVRQLGFIPIFPVLLVGSGVSLLFALLLLSVQYGILKQWCEYCLASAAASIAIFILSFLHALP